MFPSLVNCCTIDWFLPWPTEALLSVAEDAFQNTISNPDLIQQLSLNCVTMHEVGLLINRNIHLGNDVVIPSK